MEKYGREPSIYIELIVRRFTIYSMKKTSKIKDVCRFYVPLPMTFFGNFTYKMVRQQTEQQTTINCAHKQNVQISEKKCVFNERKYLQRKKTSFTICIFYCLFSLSDFISQFECSSLFLFLDNTAIIYIKYADIYIWVYTVRIHLLTQFSYVSFLLGWTLSVFLFFFLLFIISKAHQRKISKLSVKKHPGRLFVQGQKFVFQE